jgi:hypothetical protein
MPCLQAATRILTTDDGKAVSQTSANDNESRVDAAPKKLDASGHARPRPDWMRFLAYGAWL